MLNRMNKGAQKVGDISGSGGEDLIFRGGIMFCLKDVQRDGMRSSVSEFNSRMRGFVQSGQNFVQTEWVTSTSAAVAVLSAITCSASLMHARCV